MKRAGNFQNLFFSLIIASQLLLYMLPCIVVFGQRNIQVLTDARKLECGKTDRIKQLARYVGQWNVLLESMAVRSMRIPWVIAEGKIVCWCQMPS